MNTGTGSSSPASYFLRQTGQFDLLSLGGFNSPNTVLTGGYGLDGNTDHFAFVDRDITSNSRSLGLYFGSRHLEVAQDLEATDWHLFSLHVLFPASAVPDPDQVARAAWGAVRAENTDADPEQELSGTGRDSSGADLNYGGSIAVLNTIGQANLLVDYSPTSGPQVGTTDPRTFAAGTRTRRRRRAGGLRPGR